MNKVLLYIPFELKEQAKSTGAKYDPDQKSWYCDDDNQQCINEWSKRYREFKYDEKERAKSLGYKWDPNFKKWYTYSGNANV
jgi:hypothetical protein